MKKAFTLIELLVVIAIIAILAAILFPVFAQAKAAAKKTAALSNIKQNTLGVIMYQGDSDDTFPVGSPDDWEHIHLDGAGNRSQIVAGWTQTTKPYIKNLDILRDATDPKSNANLNDYLKNRLKPGGDAIYISFASNGWMTDGGTGAWGMSGVIGMAQDWMTGVKSQTATGVTNPADTIMLSTRYSSTDVWGPDSFFAGVPWWDGYVGVGGFVPDGTRDGTPYTDGGSKTFNTNNKWGGVTAAYQSKALFSWSDGHASVKDPSSTNPDPLNQPTKNQWNSRR